MNQLKIPYIEIENYELDEETVNLIPEETARAFSLIALEQYSNMLTVAMAFPENKNHINILEKRLNRKIFVVQSDFNNIITAINNNYIKALQIK